jgi:hypothetical protein
VEDYVTGDAVYVAQWTRTEGYWFTVTYAPGSEGAFEPLVFENRLVDTATPEFVGTPEGNRGWTFAGWQPEVEDYVTGDAVYVAQWTRTEGYWFTVTFNSGAQSNDEPVVRENVLRDTPIAGLVPDFTGNTGWEIVGWDPVLPETVTADATYTAQWDRIAEGYWFTVTFHSGDESEDATVTVPNVLVGTETADIAPTFTGNLGWVFDGWDPALAATVEADATYTATWERTTEPGYWFTVTFHSGDESTDATVTVENVLVGTATATIAPTFTGNLGWVFDGWDPALAATVTADATYTATWDRTTEPGYWFTVTFAPGTQGTFAAQVTEDILIGSATPEFDGTPTGNPGWTFSGWYPALAETVTANATYTALWIPVVGENGGGAGGGGGPGGGNGGGDIVAPPEPGVTEDAEVPSAQLPDDYVIIDDAAVPLAPLPDYYTIIDDEAVPLAQLPSDYTIIDDGAVPLAQFPGDYIIIDDGAVPLGHLTGDYVIIDDGAVPLSPMPQTGLESSRNLLLLGLLISLLGIGTGGYKIVKSKRKNVA